ncbi:MAG: hypothetical protein QOD75_3689 [Blastocatellia bacterium]|jgi:hypothetical protein|nr:hypothetical protein [Blastocatellia bacterium]
MDFDRNQDSQLKEYLLGTLSSESREGIEQGLMTDQELYEYLEAAEEDLIDEYLSGDLTADEKAQFEQNFLVTPERRENLRFARTLHRYVAGAQTTKSIASPSFFSRLLGSERIAFQALAAVIVLLIFAGGIWFYLSRNNTPRTFATLQLSLSLTSSRGDGLTTPRIKLPPGTDDLRLYLLLPSALNPSSRYRAVLVGQGSERKTVEIDLRDGQSLVSVVPANEVPRGEYALQLFSINPDGTEQRVLGNYYFTVD